MLPLSLFRFQIGESVLFGDRLPVADRGDDAILDEHGTSAVSLDGAHVMGDKNHGLGRILFDLREIIIALALERLVSDRQYLVQHQDVTLCFDGHGERQSDLHTRGIVLELLIHELIKLREIDDVVVHRVDLLTREAQQGTVKVHILPARQFRIESNSKLNERNQLAMNPNLAIIGIVDLRDQLQQSRLAAAIATDDAKELALMDFKADILEYRLFFVALHTLGPVYDSLLKTGRLLRWQLEALGDMVSRQHNRGLGVIVFLHCTVLSHHMTSANLRLFQRKRYIPSQSNATVRAMGNNLTPQLPNWFQIVGCVSGAMKLCRIS